MDTSGSPLSGSDPFYIKIQNKCSLDASGKACITDEDVEAEIETVMDPEISGKMMYQAGGTYTYTMNVARPGDISISIQYPGPPGVINEYYGNSVWEGPPEKINITTDINVDYGNGIVFGSSSDSFSAIFTFILEPTVTGDYIFEIEADDYGEVYLEKAGLSFIFEKIIPGTPLASSSSIPLVAGEKYKGYIKYKENSGGAGVYLRWTYPGQTKIVVPSAYYSTPAQLPLSPVQKTIT